MISPHLPAPAARPSRPTRAEEDALDEALRESFPASDAPALAPKHASAPAPLPPPEPAPAREPAPQPAGDRVAQAIEQATVGWSPTTAPALWNLALGEPPPREVLALEESATFAREPVTLIPWAFGQEPYDEVDEAIAQSFPASDPPAWTLGREPARRR